MEPLTERKTTEKKRNCAVSDLAILFLDQYVYMGCFSVFSVNADFGYGSLLKEDVSWSKKKKGICSTN